MACNPLVHGTFLLTACILIPIGAEAQETATELTDEASNLVNEGSY